MRNCPALLVSAPASGQGKTTITAALARLHRNQGRNVHVFKAGADFLDPMILERASGNPVHQLDLWMGGLSHCQQLLYQAATHADLILIEGVMGLYDGEPSSADLAIQFNLPILAVINATAMAQTFGAVAHGLATYRTGISFAGVFANQVAGSAHADMAQESLPHDLPWLGALTRHEDIRLPDRHLGLIQADEINDLDQQLNKLAEKLSHTPLNKLPSTVAFRSPAAPANESAAAQRLAGVRIAVAADIAFSFVYHANLNLLQALGAQLVFFSPLNDAKLPAVDSLYLPGGYPELHLKKLAANHAIRDAIRAHHAADKPIVAECGGMLYLLTTLIGSDGQQAAMVDILHGRAAMQTRLVNLGFHSALFPGGELRGHTFHHSQLEIQVKPAAQTQPARKGGRPESLFCKGKLTASYIHWYLPSNPVVAAALFQP